MEKLIRSCAAVMMDHEVIEKRQQPVIEYGLDLLFSSVISLLSFVTLGALLGAEMQTFWLLVIFIPLQSFGGGYHCRTHFRCWFLMLANYLLAITFWIRLPVEVLWCAVGLCAFPFLKLAPVENPKAPFNESFRRKMRRITIWVYFIAILLAALSIERGFVWGRPVLVAVMLSGFSILYAKIGQLNRIKNV